MKKKPKDECVRDISCHNLKQKLNHVFQQQNSKLNMLVHELIHRAAGRDIASSIKMNSGKHIMKIRRRYSLW